MFEKAERVNPADIAGINNQIQAWADESETIFPVEIKQLVIEDDALDALVDIVRSVSGSGRVLMVVDRTSIHRGGDDLKQLIKDRLAKVVDIAVRRFPDNPAHELHAEYECAEALTKELPGYAAVLSVGSGSVTDLAKYARHVVTEQTKKEIPFISFPTAASVTAFTSALAVLTIDGVKRTMPSRAPDAVVCDLQTLADAPRIMTQAGYGDVLARCVAYGDWHLSWQLGMDDGFSLVPGYLLGRAERAMIAAAEQVASADLNGIRAVTEAVLLAGMAMSIVQQTAPISGWEHVISHVLDLTAEYDGRKMALHGGQVGVGTLISARAYERTWTNLDVDRIAAELTDRDIDRYRQTIMSVFQPYDSSGQLTAEVWRDFEMKLSRWQQAHQVRCRFAQRKRAGEFDEFIQKAVRSSTEIEDALERARAPRRFSDLNEPISIPNALTALCYGHLIRKRFTLGDLLDHSGRLTEQTAGELLQES